MFLTVEILLWWMQRAPATSSSKATSTKEKKYKKQTPISETKTANLTSNTDLSIISRNQESLASLHYRLMTEISSKVMTLSEKRILIWRLWLKTAHLSKHQLPITRSTMMMLSGIKKVRRRLRYSLIMRTQAHSGCQCRLRARKEPSFLMVK